jgi:glycine/D-amino acid oxidase-like deaminating enzyme
MLQLPSNKQSFWREFYQTSLYPELTNDMEVDVAIIGAGITGLTAAYLLKQSGLRVVVVDKSTVGGGTTGRTTGKVTAQHNLIYAKLYKQFGAATARIYGEANQTALEQIATIVKAENIDCDWQRQHNYVYTTDLNQLTTFKHEAKIASECGLPASFETATALPFDIAGAVKFSDQAQINAQKYLLGLAHIINSGGSYVFENSNVIAIRDGSPGRIKTARACITAKHIIVATNVPTAPLIARGSYCLFEYPKESYIVAGKLPKSFKGMYISPDSHNYSLLPVTRGAEEFLLVGGEGHVSGLRGNQLSHWQRLANFAEQQFGVEQISYLWSDRDYLSYDGIPLVGKLYPWSKHVYVGTAFMKWGLTNGTVAALVLRDLITNRENAWTATFDANRLKPIRYFPKAVAQNVAELFTK